MILVEFEGILKKRRTQMLFQINLSFGPASKNALLNRAIEGGMKFPEGMKVLNMWSSVNGHKLTMFAEVENPAAMMAMADAWDDLVVFDSYPVIPSEDTIKIHQAQHQK
jgi:hypothetical protein